MLQKRKMFVLGIGTAITVSTLFSFQWGKEDDKMKKYHVIQHKNGVSTMYDTLLPMNSTYSVEDFLAEKQISTDHLEVITLPAFAEEHVLNAAENGPQEHRIIMRENSNTDGKNSDSEVKIICHVDENGNKVTKKIVNGEEVPFDENDAEVFNWREAGEAGERKVIKIQADETIIRTENGENGTEESIKITCEIDENGVVTTKKTVNGVEVEMTAEELEGLHLQDGLDGDFDREGADLMRNQGVFIEKLEINDDEKEGVSEKVIILQNDNETAGEERNFTLVMVTENWVEHAENKRKSERRMAPENKISIFPNPTTGAFTLHFTQAEKATTEITIADVHGKVVFTEKLENFTGVYDKEINLEQVGKGSYIIRLVQGDKISSEKLIIK